MYTTSLPGLKFLHEQMKPCSAWSRPAATHSAALFEQFKSHPLWHVELFFCLLLPPSLTTPKLVVRLTRTHTRPPPFPPSTFSLSLSTNSWIFVRGGTALFLGMRVCGVCPYFIHISQPLVDLKTIICQVCVCHKTNRWPQWNICLTPNALDSWHLVQPLYTNIYWETNWIHDNNTYE